MNTVAYIKTFIVVGLFLGMGFFSMVLFAHAHESSTLDTVVIHMDEHGFDPREVLVKQGTQVIFENRGETGHWPASDDHPSHMLYSGTNMDEHCKDTSSVRTFDSCGAIDPGEEWFFVFDKPGRFSYHDHLWSHFEGVIIVEGPDAVIKKRGIVGTFFVSVKEYFSEYLYKVKSFFVRNNEPLDLRAGVITDEFYEIAKSRFEAMVLDEDPREAILTLQREALEDEKLSAFCHDILHEIGNRAFEKYGSFKDAIIFQTDYCNSGYIHGIFEAYFDSVPDPSSGLAVQCEEYASINGRQFDLWQCHHGIGHGFMYLTGGDLDESLALCERSLGEAGGSSCQNGAYMEVFNLEILAKEDAFVDPDNPFATCKARDIAKADCYIYVPTYLSQRKNMDFRDIFDECEKSEFGYRSSCIYGVGLEAIKRNMNDVDSVFALCKQAGSFIHQEMCAKGVASMYMNQMGSRSSGKVLCEQSPREFRDACMSVVNDREVLFSNSGLN